MPSEKERIQELQSLQSFVQPYSKDDSSEGEQSKENGPNPIKTEAKLHQSDADSAMDPAFQDQDLGSLEEGFRARCFSRRQFPPETVLKRKQKQKQKRSRKPEPEPEPQRSRKRSRSGAAAAAGAAAEAEAEAQASKRKAEAEAKQISPNPRLSTSQSPPSILPKPEAPETPSTPIPLAAAPIALGGSPVQSSETGLSIQVLQSSPETSIDKVQAPFWMASSKN